MLARRRSLPATYSTRSWSLRGLSGARGLLREIRDEMVPRCCGAREVPLGVPMSTAMNLRETQESRGYQSLRG